MDYSKEDVINIISSALNVSGDKITKEFDDLENIDKDEFQNVLKDFADDRMNHFKKNISERSYKRAKREERTKAETELAESLGIEKMSLSDMIDHLKESKSGSDKAPNEKTQLTKEDIKKHPEFLNLVKELKEQLSEKEQSLTELQQARKSDKVNYKLDSQITKALEAINANLGESQEVQDKRLKQFKKLLTLDNKFDLDENGNIVVVDENGEPAYRDEIDLITFEDVVKSHWSWDFKEKEEKQETRIPSPRENNFNKMKVDIKTDEYNSPEEVFAAFQKAHQEGNKELAGALQEQLNKM